MPRVIAIQLPLKNGRAAFDFGPAEEFGTVEILAPNGNDILTPDVFKKFLEKGLEDFDPRRDYIIASGDYTVIFFVGLILGSQMNYVRVLRWVPHMKAYQPLLLNVDKE